MFLSKVKADVNSITHIFNMPKIWDHDIRICSKKVIWPQIPKDNRTTDKARPKTNTWKSKPRHFIIVRVFRN